MKSIAIIGAGQLGSRHLQGLCELNDDAQIFVVDPQLEALNICKERWDEVKAEAQKNIEVSFINSLDELPAVIDLVIVATTSKIRRTVVENLLSKKNVVAFILEKVLFQSLEDYKAVNELLTQKKIKCWVNCPRRVQDGYEYLKLIIEGEKNITMNVVGNNWGLGCNGIHLVDLFSFLTGDSSLQLNTDLLNKKILEARRSGYIEFSGTLTGTSSKQNNFSITSYESGISNLNIQISTPTKRISIEESGNLIITIAEEKNNWLPTEKIFPFLFQSRLTGKLANEIFTTGNCGLTAYDESQIIHLSFISALLKFMEAFTGKKQTECPIT